MSKKADKKEAEEAEKEQNEREQAVRQADKKLMIAALSGLVAGLLVFAVFRVAVAKQPTHYHANFGVYIDGKRVAFDNPAYYEEVLACSADDAGPRQRVHLHEPDSDVIHVHDEGATWGNLFENLGLSLGNDFVKTEDGFFINGKKGNISFMLNEEETRNIANKVIGDQDILLISYGDGSATLKAQYNRISDNAIQFNETADPAACSGSDKESLLDRIQRSIFE